jgi:hypothetical protein
MIEAFEEINLALQRMFLNWLTADYKAVRPTIPLY